MSGCNYGVSGCNQNSTVTSIFWLRATAGTDTTEKTSGIKHYIYMCIYILLICIIEMLQTKLSITHKPIRRDGFVGRSRTLLCSRLYNSYLLVCPLRNTGHLLPVSVRYRICTQS